RPHGRAGERGYVPRRERTRPPVSSERERTRPPVSSEFEGDLGLSPSLDWPLSERERTASAEPAAELPETDVRSGAGHTIDEPRRRRGRRGRRRERPGRETEITREAEEIQPLALDDEVGLEAPRVEREPRAPRRPAIDRELPPTDEFEFDEDAET